VLFARKEYKVRIARLKVVAVGNQPKARSSTCTNRIPTRSLMSSQVAPGFRRLPNLSHKNNNGLAAGPVSVLLMLCRHEHTF
jgi:hypothetical protein